MSFIAKSSRLTRDVAKWAKRLESKAERVARDRATAAAWTEVSKLVRARDANRCRVCGGLTTKVGMGDPRRWGHVHHIVYRSAGGGDYPLNLVLLCGQCHDDEHRHLIDIRGTALKLSVTRPPSSGARG